MPVPEVQSPVVESRRENPDALRGLQESDVECGGQENQTVAAARARADTFGYIYILGTMSRVDPKFRGPYKIGKTYDPETRISQIRAAYAAVVPKMPFVVGEAFLLPCKGRDLDSAERFIHLLLDQWRWDGEWFNLPDSVVKGLSLFSIWSTDLTPEMMPLHESIPPWGNR